MIRFMSAAVPPVITGCSCCASENYMRQVIKTFFCIGALLGLFGLQSVRGYALLGPTGNGGDSWQVLAIGYNLVYYDNWGPGLNGNPEFLGDIGGPKNIGEEYRRNASAYYYAYNANFLGFFGSNGVAAVDSAFAVMNGLTNVSSYSTSLNEFPLESQQINPTAQSLALTDLKSVTLHLLVEQMGLAQPERFTWTLHNRNATPPGCPLTTEYLVVRRNFDVTASPFNQIQYSPYVNDTLYSFIIIELCTQPPGNPVAFTVPFSVDPFATT